MRHGLFVVVGAVAALGALGACHDEPTYVVNFDTHDMATSRGAAPAPLPTVARQVDECATDADCVVVRADCCGCATGGRQTALARTNRADHEAALDKACGPSPKCPGKPRPSEPSCAMIAKCVEKRCMLAEAPRSTAAPTVETACKVAADCTVVPDGCCDCASGGKQRTVARRFAGELVAAQQKKCAGTACVAMMSTDPTCAEVPDCIAGHCQLVDAAKKK